jgi:hypothetical protein
MGKLALLAPLTIALARGVTRAPGRTRRDSHEGSS